MSQIHHELFFVGPLCIGEFLTSLHDMLLFLLLFFFLPAAVGHCEKRRERKRKENCFLATFLVVVLLQPAFSQTLSSLSVFLDPHTNDIIYDVPDAEEFFRKFFFVFLLDFHYFVSVLYRNQVGHENCIYKVAEVRCFFTR